MEHQKLDPRKRHEFVVLFDVKNGNPNGDPDNDNLPRTDPETGHGIVTDVCLKRKIRDYVEIVKEGQPRYAIYIRKSDMVALNEKHQKAYDELKLKSSGTKQKVEEARLAEFYMRGTYYDVRSFGAVMTTGVNCGQVRGPLQLTFSRSVDPVYAHDITITRVAVTKPEDMVVSAEDSKKKSKQTEMGRKALVPYGLYMGYCFYNPFLGEPRLPDKSKALLGDDLFQQKLEKNAWFSEEDMDLFCEALCNMFEFDRSASRGVMGIRRIYVFSHDGKAGNAHANLLFERIKPRLQDGVEIPRDFSEYTVEADDHDLPPGVELTRLC